MTSLLMPVVIVENYGEISQQAVVPVRSRGSLLGSGRPPMPIMRAAVRVWVRFTRVAVDRTSSGMQFGDDYPTRLAYCQMVHDLLKAIEVTEPECVLDQLVRQRVLLHKE